MATIARVKKQPRSKVTWARTEEGELRLLPAMANELPEAQPIADALQRVGPVVPFATIVSDGWWDGCRWDD